LKVNNLRSLASALLNYFIPIVGRCHILEGKGLTITVFDVNTTGSLAPFNGMFIAGIHEEDTDMGAATFTLGNGK
jgi:hypothetical protein